MFKKAHRHAQAAAKGILRCSFCNKNQNDVRELIAGPTVFICDECVEVCNDIIADQRARQETSGVEPQAPLDVLSGGPEDDASVRCSLCSMTVVAGDVLAVQDRGVLCLGCIGEIEAAVQSAREAKH